MQCVILTLHCNSNARWLLIYLPSIHSNPSLPKINDYEYSRSAHEFVHGFFSFSILWLFTIVFIYLKEKWIHRPTIRKKKVSKWPPRKPFVVNKSFFYRAHGQQIRHQADTRLLHITYINANIFKSTEGSLVNENKTHARCDV